MYSFTIFMLSNSNNTIMKKTALLFTLVIGLIITGLSQQTYSPYYKVAEFDTNMNDISTTVKDIITNGGFNIIGEYNPANNDDLKVICFTNDELGKMSLQYKDRGALASVLKAGLVKKDGTITLSILNPEYMFVAYWGEQMERSQEDEVTKMSESVLSIFATLGKLTPFGGREEKDDLKKYHYKVMMPYFDDPEELREFDSFESGLSIIRKNLNNGKGNTVKVYEQIFPGQKIAVFGVGLNNSESGEANFLPIIGEDNIANMPYEIILQDNEATMLAGKYRIALFWPELTMGTFMKIMSTPGDIEDTMEGLCEN